MEDQNLNEPNANVGEGKPTGEQNTPQANTPSLEEQLKAIQLENLKLKKAMDKAASETASYKKQLREKQTADEIALQEKAEKEAERDAQLQALLRENQINKLEKGFLSLGYSPEQANKSAIAQLDGDTDTLFKIQSVVQASAIQSAQAEWLKSRPTVNAGVGGDQTNITKEQFAKMSYREMVEFKAKFPQLYATYSQK